MSDNAESPVVPPYEDLEVSPSDLTPLLNATRELTSAEIVAVLDPFGKIGSTYSASARGLDSLDAFCASLIAQVTHSGLASALAVDEEYWHLNTAMIGSLGQVLVIARPIKEWTERECSLAEAIASSIAMLHSQSTSRSELLHRQRLDELVAAVAVRLMSADADTRAEVLSWVLQTLAEFIDADVAFIRRNDFARNLTIMDAEWPDRHWEGPDPDPLGEVPMEGDEVWAIQRTQKQPYFIGETQTSEEYLATIEAGSGVPEVGGGTVPILMGDITWGILGFLHFRYHVWTAAEVRALQAVASMLAHLQGRLDAEARIIYNATHDELTDLANRRALVAEIDRRVADREAFSLMILDLDRFKVMNDYLGHAAGDQLLAAVANRMRFGVRGDDFTARLGGDEFVFLTATGDSLAAVASAHRLLTIISQPVYIAGQEITHTASIGITTVKPNAPAENALVLLARADVALYSAKAGGRDQVVVYDDELHTKVTDRSRVELELAEALTNKELRLHYQPEVDLRTGKMNALEALVRWQHPTRGLLAAGEFITVAEETGLITRIGRWVFEEACRQHHLWSQEYPNNGVMLRVNMSPRDFRSPDLLSFIKSTLLVSQVPPSAMCIEITEHAIIGDGAHLAEVLNDLRALGIEVAIDDFGTGFSTMTELKNIPTDSLKLDMSFVRGITNSRYDRAIVKAIVTLAEALDLYVIGEGVEDFATAQELIELGCHRAQGYLIARPGAPADLAHIFAAGGVDENHYPAILASGASRN